MPRLTDQAQARVDHELEFLRTTVFHCRTKDETRRAAVTFVYDLVLAQLIANSSTTMADLQPRKAA